jgi:hypothetical protein
VTSQEISITKANRRDHYLPQGYLCGFIDPARTDRQRPLWHFDIPNRVWSEKSPREVGYRFGFYDYATRSVGLETADSVFAPLESTFPKVRDTLISTGFRGWREDFLEFLLCYVQMIRARSLLFFERVQEEGKNLRALTVEAVSPDRKSLKVRSMIPEPLPRAFIRNWTITQMKEEIQKGPAWLSDLNWAIRLCDSPGESFIISEIPFVAQGRYSQAADVFRDPEVLLFFPLCWQACLIGSPRPFDVETDKFGKEDTRRVQKIYRETAELFLLSATKIDFD